MLNLVMTIWVLAIPATGSVEPVSTSDAIITNVMQTYQLDPSTTEVEILANSLRTAAVLPNQISIRPLTSKEPEGLFMVKAVVTIDGVVVESAQVRLKIKRFGEVLVLTDRVKRHDAISADKLSRRRMEITNLQEQPVESPDCLVGNRARRNLPLGDILTTGDIEPIPEVEPGREVSIVYSDGRCTITAPGTVLQTGQAGDYVKVKNTASNQIIIARVVDKTAVAVDP